MSRKAHYLQLSETKDRGICNLLNNCRHCKLEHLRAAGASQNRINAYMKEKLLERIETQHGAIYRLTDKGYKQLDKQIGLENMRYHSQSIEHDLRLSDYYIKVISDNPNAIWKNEEDLKAMKRDELNELREQGRFLEMEQLREMSVPDCIIVSDIVYGYDVVTDNYSNIDIQLKEEFCEHLEIELRLERC